MDDKTSSSLQPSTTFDDSYPPTTLLPRPLNQYAPTSAYSTTYKSTNLPGISNLLNMDNQHRQGIFSPPEETMDFTPIQSKGGYKMITNVRGQAPLSPPISPEAKNATPDDSTIVVRDPILFPSREGGTSPLFASDNEIHRSVERHLASREASTFREVSPPRNSEYQLALEFKSQVAKAFNANRRLWARREMAQLREDTQLRRNTQIGHNGRPFIAIAPASGARPTVRAPVKTTKPSNGSVRKVSQPKPVYPRGMTPESTKRVAREDKDFASLPDYSPPLSSLPSKPNSLKVDWKGAPIDLKSDPHAHLLHPDEIYLAANLRLDCATYLTSKRRIFIKRIEAYKIGKEFRKTDAQQACKIDVNKASKLWQAFDKVGWLDVEWIRDFV